MRDRPFDLAKMDRTDVTTLKAAGKQLWYTFVLIMKKYPNMEVPPFYVEHLQQFMAAIHDDEKRFSRRLIESLFDDYCSKIEYMGDYWRVWPIHDGLDDDLRKAASRAIGEVVVCRPVNGGNDYVLTPPGYGADPTTQEGTTDD